jgi:hypothetical protein
MKYLIKYRIAWSPTFPFQLLMQGWTGRNNNIYSDLLIAGDLKELSQMLHHAFLKLHEANENLESASHH